MSAAKPTTVFISALLPKRNGSGSEIRAWNWLQELREQQQVLLITPSAHGPLAPMPGVAHIQLETTHTARWQRGLYLLLPVLSRWQPHWQFEALQVSPNAFADALRQIMSQVEGESINRVVVMKSAMHGFAQALLGHLPPSVRAELDLDDDETLTRFSLFRCALTLRIPVSAGYYLSTALSSWWSERHYRRYQKVWVAAAEDIPRLQQRLGPREQTRVDLKANTFAPVASAPMEPDARKSCDKICRILFVGTLNYLPNMEAIERIILPLARHFQARTDLKFVVAGRDPSARLMTKLQRQKNIELHINAPDLSGIYQQAQVVLVPIFSGGGSKVKTFEALAYGKTIIASAHGCGDYRSQRKQNASTPSRWQTSLLR